MCRKNETDFTRDRKITPADIVMYNLNNRGLSNKAELKIFNKITKTKKVSSTAMLEQRKKLNENVFKKLSNDLSECFYTEYKEEVKTFKGYVLTATDGSDAEVPNTKETKERYQAKNSSNDERVARIKLSNNYDLLNYRVLDTEIAEYKHSELDLARKHQEAVKKVIGEFKTIDVRDRGYFSLSDFYYFLKNKQKFVIRLNTSYLKEEVNSMSSDDECLEIKYQYDRIRNYKEKDKEFYEYYMNGNTITLRFVRIILPTGEEEIILTNLEDDFKTEDIDKIYQLRWGIETSYNILKNSMKVCNISSSFDCIIKQEIYATMLVFNMLQPITLAAENEIEQDNFKHKMRINFNMAVGCVKRGLIEILIEENDEERDRLLNTLFNEILEEIVPVRPNRKFPRNKGSVKNKNHINYRKSY